MDERRVRAILQQTAHEIGQQILMRTNGCVDTHRTFAAGRLVERDAHAVQALELVLVAPCPFRHQLDRRKRMRVVRGELRIDGRACLDQRFRAGEIGDIGCLLGREDRIVRLAVDLSALHFRVPVGAFDEPDHQAAFGLARQISQPADHGFASLLIGLHCKTQPSPACEVLLAR